MTVLTCSFIKTEIVHVLQIVQQRSSEVMNLTVNLLGIKKRNVSNQINAHIRPSLAFAAKNKMKKTKKGLSFLVQLWLNGSYRVVWLIYFRVLNRMICLMLFSYFPFINLAGVHAEG
jgi:hypothetical protein